MVMPVRGIEERLDRRLRGAASNIRVWLMTPLTPRNGTQAMARISVLVQNGTMKAMNSASRQPGF